MTQGSGIASASEAKAIAYEFAVLTEAIKQTRERRDLLRRQLLEYMDEQSLSSVRDDEADVAVERLIRSGRKSYDVPSMPASLVLTLHTLSVLRVDLGAAKSITPPWRDEIERYALVGDPTFALVVRHGQQWGESPR